MNPPTNRFLIVGAGVMGAVVGKYLQSRGNEVTWFDDKRQGAGSQASAGMIIESWSPLTAPDHVRGLHILDELYGLRSVRFSPKVMGLFVSPLQFLDVPAQRETIEQIGSGWIRTKDNTHLGRVILATGCWVKDLYAGADNVKAWAGTSFTIPGTFKPVLQEWAPYKQIMSFGRDPGSTWIGDGTSILRHNYTHSRIAQTRDRCAGALGVSGAEFNPVTGYRPYVTGMKQGVCVKIMHRVWMLTGGGKSSTILAAHYAQKLLKEHV